MKVGFHIYAIPQQFQLIFLIFKLIIYNEKAEKIGAATGSVGTATGIAVVASGASASTITGG